MEDWQAKKAARAAAAKALQAAFPHLLAVGSERGKNDALNAAAKNIRTVLKLSLPGVKFSVKSRRFSGGDAIDVRWIDGPTSAQVDEILGRYVSGTFDAMTDCAGVKRSAWTDAFGDARFVSGARDNSDRAIASAIRTVVAKYGQAAAVATVAGYRKGSYWNVFPAGGEWSGANCLGSLIGQVLQTRTWALNKAPAGKSQAAEEVAA